MPGGHGTIAHVDHDPPVDGDAGVTAPLHLDRRLDRLQPPARSGPDLYPDEAGAKGPGAILRAPREHDLVAG